MPDFAFHQRHVISECSAYYACMDELRRENTESPTGFDQMLVIHLDFHDFTKQALERLLHEWHLFRHCVTAPLFAYCAPDEPNPRKWERFVGLLGFQQLPNAILPGDGGLARRIFVSTNASEDNYHQQYGGPKPDEPVGAANPVPDAGLSGRE